MGFRTKQTPPPARRRAAKNKREEQFQRTAYTYRRNRTLTGSLVSRIPSAGESKAQLRSPRMHAHDLRRTRRHVALSLGVVVGLLAAVWFALDNVIATPIVAGNLTSNHQLYQAKINDYLTAHPLERFRFALNTSRLAAYLQTHDCPEVAAVLPATQQAGLGRSTITLAMRQAAVVWTVNRQQLFVDTEGHAFRRAYGPRPSIEVVDDSGIGTRNNQVVASNQFLGFIGKVVGAVRRHQLTVQKITWSILLSSRSIARLACRARMPPGPFAIWRSTTSLPNISMSASVAERRIGRETVDNTSASLVNSVGIEISAFSL